MKNCNNNIPKHCQKNILSFIDSHFFFQNYYFKPSVIFRLNIFNKMEFYST